VNRRNNLGGSELRWRLGRRADVQAQTLNARKC
jgi:hypothetical protein